MIGVILLAAGASQRLGKPKQSLFYKGETLLHHAMNVALSICPETLVVVLGSGAEVLKEQVKDRRVQVIVNTDWSQGMSTSIRHGLLSLLRLHPVIEAVIIMVCDQPYVSTDLLKQLQEKRLQTHKKIIASAYGDVAGVPALFDKSFFPDLLALRDQEGAKKIIRMNFSDVETVSFPEGKIDIDTKEDYEALEK